MPYALEATRGSAVVRTVVTKVLAVSGAWNPEERELCKEKLLLGACPSGAPDIEECVIVVAVKRVQCVCHRPAEVRVVIEQAAACPVREHL